MSIRPSLIPLANVSGLFKRRIEPGPLANPLTMVSGGQQ